ncbi:chemotaxis-specific protein-glutamate methyltransferase CheB [Sulfuriferula thiophila]|uniref:chemotaxis-specific protein-glutamate methyltransferase CheB n=1 Tax=Sulfuriferula thiophila TaxID=1781211 RepID=UPI000F610B5A|nr:chemotaxis-specific protein-glutamate methyltransferase CheB [Sulfuriferula thiophila]
MIRILIVEDSQVIALLLKAIFEAESDMQVVGHAKNGREGVQLAHELKPDLITMDIRMPEMDGFEATRMIMANDPAPVVVISSGVDDEELQTTFRAIEEGALSVIEKPPGFAHPDFEVVRRELVETVRAMAEVKVIRRRSLSRTTGTGSYALTMQQPAKDYELVAIGCSTGGPQVLQKMLSLLPADFPVPVVVTQHISKGFIGGLVSWLAGNTTLKIKQAEQGEQLQAATVYFAPDDQHLQVIRRGSKLVVKLSADAPENGFRPSASVMLKSVATACASRAVGVLLTGMGVDGADGLLALRQAGGHTLVQDQESAVVYGMPGAAIALDAVDQVVAMDGMATYLCRVVGK